MEFVDWLVEVGNAIWAFFGVAENSDRAVAIATVLGTVFVFFGGLWVVIKGLFRVFRPKPEPAAQQINMDLTAAAPSEPILQMTLAQFDAKQRDLRDEVTNRLKQAHAKDRDQLLSQLDEINARLREPQKALDEALVRVKDLENRLDREANRFGADRIDAAKAALADLDYSKAEELFEQIDADAAIAVQSAARAQYGLGEIAEARVDWAKAAQHYRRAAELDADLDTLGKAADFSERAGDYALALPLSDRAVTLAKAASPDRYSNALNDHALLLKSTGRYAEAEPLYKQAMQIDKAALGVDHPTYATRLNNLAVLYYHMARFDAALPLIEQALRIRETALPAGHPHIEEARRNLAAIKSKQDTGD